jgi:hypothetical protein
MDKKASVRRNRFLLPVAICMAILLSPFPIAAKEGMLFILDCSGSMWGRVNDIPKIVLAKDALLSVVSEMPEDVDVGLMAYGHRRKGDCDDLEFIVDLGGSRKDMKDRLASLNAKGKTPISGALIRAGEMLAGKEDPVTIILVSDGIETCQDDPCRVAAELIEKGIKLVIHVVGFDVDTDAADQLDCIAGAGNGHFFKADDIGQLKEALTAVKQAVVEKKYLPEQPQIEPVKTETAPSRTLRIAGPGTVKLAPASWVKMPPRHWALAQVETGEIMATGKGNELRARAGEYQILWRQSEHGHSDILLTAVVRVESGKTVTVPIDTGIRLTIPDGIEAPRAWGLVMPGEKVPFWKTSETGKPQVVPAGSYQLYWNQSEHESRPVILGLITIESGGLTEAAADLGLVLHPAEWAPNRYYYYGLKNAAGEMAGSWQKCVPQLAPGGEYTLILRPREHHHNDIVWGRITVPEHGFVDIPINSGLKFIHAPDARPPYGIFLKNLDSGHEIAARETWDPIPLPPGRYRLDWWERQHESVRQTLADEFIVEPGVLVEVEM